MEKITLMQDNIFILRYFHCEILSGLPRNKYNSVNTKGNKRKRNNNKNKNKGKEFAYK